MHSRQQNLQETQPKLQAGVCDIDKQYAAWEHSPVLPAFVLKVICPTSTLQKLLCAPNALLESVLSPRTNQHIIVGVRT